MNKKTEKPWLKNYDKGVPSNISYRRMTIPEMFDKTVEAFPNHTALIYQGTRISYRELSVLVDNAAGHFYTLGIRKGDAVGIWLPNCVPAVVSYYAVLKLGGVVVMNNPLYSDREIGYQASDSDFKILITLDLLAERAIKLREKTGIHTVIYASLGDYLPAPLRWLFPLIAVKKGLAAKVPPTEEVYSWKNIVAKGGLKPPVVNIQADSAAVYQYTGGTTGISRGAILTHENLTCMVQMYEAWFQVNKGEEIVLGAPPVFHILGMSTAMNLPFYMGWATIMVPKPQSDMLLKAIRKFRPTMAPLVPTMYIGMLGDEALSKTDLSCFKLITSGASSLPSEILDRFRDLTGAEINEGYGMTETSPQTHLNPLRGRKKAGSIGIPFPDTEVKIMDIETGTKEMPVGEAGEMWFKGPQVTKGYLNMPKETDEAFSDGWLKSGDIAYMDEDGYFFIVDRKKDLIISSGYNVYPREIEEVLYTHPAVLKAAAIGIADPKRGENVRAYIVLKDGDEASYEELMEHCRGSLAKYKWPAEIVFRDELPETALGKTLKNSLRKEL